MRIDEKSLRTKIRAILLAENRLLVETLRAKAQALTTALNNITGDARSGVGQGPAAVGGAHFRIRTDTTSALPSKELEVLAKQIVDEVFGFVTSSVENVGQVNSKTYDTYRVTNEDTGQGVNIIFTGTITSGQRGGGYQYEVTIDKALADVGLESGVGTDTTQSDVFVQTTKGSVGIEVKGARGKFGEPALHYDYGTGQWVVPATSRSKENAQLVADLLNGAQDAGLNAWLDSLKDAWDADHPEAPMGEFGQITDEEYAAMRARGITQAGPKVEIDIQTIIDYYVKKKADYIQIQDKGLFTIAGDPLGVGATAFAQGMSGLPTTVRPSIMTMGGNRKKIRASMELPYHKGSASSLNLELPEDAQKFADAAQGVAIKEGNFRMKITKRQLRRIIKEEKAKVLAEQSARRIVRRQLIEQATWPQASDLLSKLSRNPNDSASLGQLEDMVRGLGTGFEVDEALDALANIEFADSEDEREEAVDYATDYVRDAFRA